MAQTNLSRMLKDAHETKEHAYDVLTQRTRKAEHAATKALKALGELAERWETGEADLQEVRNTMIKAHNDIMRAPSPFSIDQARRRAAGAEATVIKIEGATNVGA